MYKDGVRLAPSTISTPKGFVEGVRPCLEERRNISRLFQRRRYGGPKRFCGSGALRRTTSAERDWLSRWPRMRRPIAGSWAEGWGCIGKRFASGGSAGPWKGFLSRTSRDRVGRGLFPPRVVAQVKAIACELPALRGLPLSRFSIMEIRRTVLSERIVEAVGASTIWRWLDEDALRPWRHHPWIFPRDPAFAEKAGRVLDLYQGVWEGEAIGPNDYVISADEKTSIQARDRRHRTQAPCTGRAMRVEHEYKRGGAVAYLAALDVFGGRVMGHVSPKSGIVPFNALIELVMSQEPYASAERVFWIVDNGSSHHPGRFPARLAGMYPNAIAVHLPIHASWLNQIEIFFSILQRKVLTPNDFPDTDTVTERILRFERHYNATAQPFQWTFTRDKLNDFIRHFDMAA